MLAVVNCPSCHHSNPESERAFCGACGAPLATKDRSPDRPRLDALETWSGWDGLLASQQATMSYWFMTRRDYTHLRGLAEAWESPNDPVRRLLLAKLDRALVSDPDQFPSDAVSIGTHLQFRLRGEINRCVLADPAHKTHTTDVVSVLSPLGALLLGTLEGRPLRGQDPDGAAFTLIVEKVEQPASLRVSSGSEAA